MKKLIALIGLLAGLVYSAQAQQTMVLTSLAANTVSNIVAFPCIIDNFNVVNSTTNVAQVNFYDSAGLTTNYVQGAYTSYASYATNFSVVFTNQTGVLVTNTFAGIYTAPTSNSSSTNTRALLFSAIVPANSVLSKDVKIQTIRGLNAVPNQAVTLVTTYRTQY